MRLRDRAAVQFRWSVIMLGPGSVEQNRSPRVWLLTTCGACTSRCIISYARREWSDEVLLALMREYLQPEMTRKPTVVAWISDDMRLPKKSRHSVGVTRQYSGQTGNKDNCRAPFFVSRRTNLLSRSVACKRYAWSSESPDKFSVGFALLARSGRRLSNSFSNISRRWIR